MLVTKYKNEKGVIDKVVLTSEGPQDVQKLMAVVAPPAPPVVPAVPKPQ